MINKKEIKTVKKTEDKQRSTRRSCGPNIVIPVVKAKK